MNIELPKDAKKNGARVRWWQPQNVGQSRSDWVIDDIVIGGKETNPNEVNDDFGSGRRTVDWLQLYNVRFGAYCGVPYAAVARATSDEGVVMTTSDVAVGIGDVIEFSLLVAGCNASWDLEVVKPVLLEYSVDYGLTWKMLVEECAPFQKKCGGKAAMASVYYSTVGWMRVTVPLGDHAVSKYSFSLSVLIWSAIPISRPESGCRGGR